MICGDDAVLEEGGYDGAHGGVHGGTHVGRK